MRGISIMVLSDEVEVQIKKHVPQFLESLQTVPPTCYGTQYLPRFSEELQVSKILPPTHLPPSCRQSDHFIWFLPSSLPALLL